MTPPAVALLRCGPVWIPLPLVLLWPFLFVALAIGGLVETAKGGVALPLTRTVCVALGQLHGVKVDIESATGSRVFLWLV